MKASFEWDYYKNRVNQKKHNISFEEAQFAFQDSNRIIVEDITHSTVKETRYLCIGKIGDKICTVRFTYRANTIRIFGAGYWRQGKKRYEKENS